MGTLYKVRTYSAASAAALAALSWNCSDSVEPVSAVVEDVPPMMVNFVRACWETPAAMQMFGAWTGINGHKLVATACLALGQVSVT